MGSVSKLKFHMHILFVPQLISAPIKFEKTKNYCCQIHPLVKFKTKIGLELSYCDTFKLISKIYFRSHIMGQTNLFINLMIKFQKFYKLTILGATKKMCTLFYIMCT